MFCEWCGKTLPAPKPRTPNKRRFCDAYCRMMQWRHDNPERYQAQRNNPMPSKHPNAARQSRLASNRLPRKCKLCDTIFTPSRSTQVHCEAHTNAHKAKNSTKTGKSTLEPGTGPQKCGYGPCSTMFEPKRYNHKYCSPRCQDLAELERARTNEEVKERRRQAMREYYQRNKTEIQAKQRETWPARAERRKAYRAAQRGDGVQSFERIGLDDRIRRVVLAAYQQAGEIERVALRARNPDIDFSDIYQQNI